MNNDLPIKYGIGMLLTALFVWTGVQAQDYQSILANNRITTHTDGHHKQIFEVRERKRNARADLTYHWYASRRIRQSTGGYSGKVLHGGFTEYYPNNQLHLKGSFKKGLKSGEWRTWSSSGILIRQSKWNKSKETGSYALFNEEGHLLERGKQYDGRRHGKIMLYSARDSNYVHQYYSHGKETTKEAFVRDQDVFSRTGYYLQKQWTALFKKKEV